MEENNNTEELEELEEPDTEQEEQQQEEPPKEDNKQEEKPQPEPPKTETKQQQRADNNLYTQQANFPKTADFQTQIAQEVNRQITKLQKPATQQGNTGRQTSNNALLPTGKKKRASKKGKQGKRKSKQTQQREQPYSYLPLPPINVEKPPYLKELSDYTAQRILQSYNGYIYLFSSCIRGGLMEHYNNIANTKTLQERLQQQGFYYIPVYLTAPNATTQAQIADIMFLIKPNYSNIKQTCYALTAIKQELNITSCMLIKTDYLILIDQTGQQAIRYRTLEEAIKRYSRERNYETTGLLLLNPAPRTKEEYTARAKTRELFPTLIQSQAQTKQAIKKPS